MEVGINPDYDYLYDPQQDKPQCFCRVCGREIYTQGRDVHIECENS